MTRPTHHTRVHDTVVIEPGERRPAHRPGEIVAKAVALIGGASLVLGGALGYAFGYLEGLRQKGDRHEV